MKTALMRVRITEKQEEFLREVEDIILPNKAIQKALDNWIHDEGSVYLEHARKARAEIGKRQPVMPVRAAELKAVQN